VGSLIREGVNGMSKKQVATWQLMPCCIKCDDPLEEIDDAFPYPMYDSEILCKSCFDVVKAVIGVNL